jgi:hypothetical protein
MMDINPALHLPQSTAQSSPYQPLMLHMSQIRLLEVERSNLGFGDDLNVNLKVVNITDDTAEYEAPSYTW